MALGERFGQTWYGQKGAMTQIGDRMQCHVCGKAFHHLGNHVAVTHEMSCDDYRDEFGLKASTGLISPKLAEKRQKTAHFSKPGFLASKCHRRGNPLIREISKGRKVSLQERIERRDHLERLMKLGQEAIRRRIREGTYVRPRITPEQCREASRKAQIKLKQLRSDPEWKRAWAAKISATKGRVKDCVCTGCGVTFQQPRQYSRKTCSAECLKRRKRDRQREMVSTPEVREKMSAAAKNRSRQRKSDGRWR